MDVLTPYPMGNFFNTMIIPYYVGVKKILKHEKLIHFTISFKFDYKWSYSSLKVQLYFSNGLTNV